MALRLTAPTRWVSAVAVAGAAAIVLAACGGDRPDGVDGDLTDQWGGFAEAARFEPAAQVCHPDGFRATAPLPEYQPVGCDQPHQLETVYVGTFEDFEEAELDAPPAPDSSEHRQAYRQCEREAADYLGADFREGRLWLGVALPSAAGWDGGARWYRCDLMEVESVYAGAVERQGTLAGQLAGDSADPNLRLGCYQVAVDDSDVAELSPVACDETHEAEFVGVWRKSGGGYPDGDDEQQDVYDGCRERVAEYVDVPADGDLVFRTGAIADWMSEQDWAAGDRGFRCYLWLPDRELTESLAGDGDDALPIQ